MSEFIHGITDRHDGPADDIEGEVFIVPISIRKSDVVRWEGYHADPSWTLFWLRDGTQSSVDMEYRDFTRQMEE